MNYTDSNIVMESLTKITLKFLKIGSGSSKEGQHNLLKDARRGWEDLR